MRTIYVVSDIYIHMRRQKWQRAAGPQLPPWGWFDKCIVCQKITSRVICICEYGVTYPDESLCVTCREPALRLLRTKYDVWITDDTVARLDIVIKGKLVRLDPCPPQNVERKSTEQVKSTGET